MQSSRSWLEISGSRLRHNYRALIRVAAAAGRDISVLPVVKAGAYGHGAGLCARVLAELSPPWLGVTDAAEGASVRRSLDLASYPRETQPRILVMCGLLPSEASVMVVNQLTPVLWNLDQLATFSGLVNTGNPFTFHLEIDTGMSRQGVLPGGALNTFLDRLLDQPQFQMEGVLTHFASAEIAGDRLTAEQRCQFETALTQISARGLSPAWIHAGNSSTVDEASSLPWLQSLANRYRARSMVRSGLAMYGYALPIKGAQGLLEHDLKPVLTWKTRIMSISEVPAGASIGYNATYIAQHAMRLALLPVGYSDGLRRGLSATNAKPGGWVTIHNTRAPIIGKISMNLTAVDVTTIPEAGFGDEVTLIGEGITAADHARLTHTIPYEILCGLRSEAKLSD